MTGTIGAKALYLLFLWLLSAAGGASVSDRKGYTARVGLTFGLVLTFVGFLIVLLLPARPGSVWKTDGALPRRSRPTHRGMAADGLAPVADMAAPRLPTAAGPTASDSPAEPE